MVPQWDTGSDPRDGGFDLFADAGAQADADALADMLLDDATAGSRELGAFLDSWGAGGALLLAATMARRLVQAVGPAPVGGASASDHRVPDLAARPAFGELAIGEASAAELDGMLAQQEALQQAFMFAQAVAAVSGYPEEAALLLLGAIGPFARDRDTVVRFLSALAGLCRPGRPGSG